MATHPAAITRAASHLPGWLASNVRRWIEAEEARGAGFTTAAAAVQHALAELAHPTR